MANVIADSGRDASADVLIKLFIFAAWVDIFFVIIIFFLLFVLVLLVVILVLLFFLFVFRNWNLAVFVEPMLKDFVIGFLWNALANLKRVLNWCSWEDLSAINVTLIVLEASAGLTVIGGP